MYAGHATFLDDHTLDTGTGERVTADQIVIAAGSRVDVAPIAGLDEVPFHTSDTVMRLDELPGRMAIVGGGLVAAEFAHIFSALGTEVVQVHRGPRLLQGVDEDVSARFTEIAGRQWEVRLEASVEKAARRGEGVVLALSDSTEVEVDVVLVATGRRPNADRLGLEHTSIALDDDIVAVDDHQRTSVDGVWALGDVANHVELKHLANAEADTVQHNLLHPDDLVRTDRRFVPSAVFTSPQIASVGLTEQQAREKGVAFTTAVEDFGGVAFGWAMEDSDHFVKLLADPGGTRLLGAHIIGPQAALLLQPLVQAISLGTTVSEMSRGQLWIHPSLAEVVENALLEIVSSQSVLERDCSPRVSSGGRHSGRASSAPLRVGGWGKCHSRSVHSRFQRAHLRCGWHAPGCPPFSPRSDAPTSSTRPSSPSPSWSPTP